MPRRLPSTVLSKRADGSTPGQFRKGAAGAGSGARGGERLRRRASAEAWPARRALGKFTRALKRIPRRARAHALAERRRAATRQATAARGWARLAGGRGGAVVATASAGRGRVTIGARTAIRRNDARPAARRRDDTDVARIAGSARGGRRIARFRVLRTRIARRRRVERRSRVRAASAAKLFFRPRARFLGTGPDVPDAARVAVLSARRRYARRAGRTFDRRAGARRVDAAIVRRGGVDARIGGRSSLVGTSDAAAGDEEERRREERG